jgi:trimethylamine:corrinoid methyltransferase-like protein
LSAAYGVPVHTAGLTTDALAAGAQAMIEHSLYAMTVLRAGASILGRAGELEAARTFSPVQMVIDDEIAGAMKRLGGLSAELETDESSPAWEETLAWEDVLAVDPGGHFLESPHTLRHCREAFRPRLFLRQSRDDWQAAGGRHMTDRARLRIQELLGTQPGRPLEPPKLPAGAAEAQTASEQSLAGVQEELRRIVREADRALGSGGRGA